MCESTTEVRLYKECAEIDLVVGSFYIIRGARVRDGIVAVWGDAHMQQTAEAFDVTSPLHFV